MTINIKDLFSTAIVFFTKMLGVPTPPLTILGYHSVSYTDTLVDITPEEFLKQISYMKKVGYNFISWNEALDHIENGKKIAKPSAVITFDDGYKDLFTNVLPHLIQMQIPSTIFAVSHPHKVDRERIENDKPLLSIADLITLSKSPLVHIEGHTSKHINVSEYSRKELIDDLLLSKRTLEAITNKPVQFFAYPWGESSQEAIEALVLAGYRGAVTTEAGFPETKINPYLIPRIMVDRTHSLAQFKFMLRYAYPNFVRLLASLREFKAQLESLLRYPVQGIQYTQKLFALLRR